MGRGGERGRRCGAARRTVEANSEPEAADVLSQHATEKAVSQPFPKVLRAGMHGCPTRVADVPPSMAKEQAYL